jgi:hypothetical protein
MININIGYVLSPPDNGNYMFYKMEIDRCTKYSNIYDINRVNSNFKVSNKNLHITETYDGYKIVSEKFKLFCERENYSNIEFVELSTAGFYWFKVYNILEYDTVTRQTQFINYNQECGGYEEIIGATPAYLKCKLPLSDDFFRTDVCFGSYHRKSPLYIVGEKTQQKLISAGFTEIYFDKIISS